MLEARRLGAISLLETVSFAALLVAMFVESEAGVSFLGAIHGMLFLAYAYFLWVDHDDLGWSGRSAIGSILTGPIGALVVLERLRREHF